LADDDEHTSVLTSNEFHRIVLTNDKRKLILTSNDIRRCLLLPTDEPVIDLDQPNLDPSQTGDDATPSITTSPD
jgi:hypothetical protein